MISTHIALVQIIQIFVICFSSFWFNSTITLAYYINTCNNDTSCLGILVEPVNNVLMLRYRAYSVADLVGKAGAKLKVKS